MGIGSRIVVAKVSSDFNQPDGLFLIEPENVEAFFSPMPVRKIPGIGNKSECELFEIDIRTIGDLGVHDIQSLIARFGRGGIWLLDIALGIDECEVKERSVFGSVSREITYEQDTDDPQVLAAIMDILATDMHRILLS
jgi:DNA polymerase IV (DinB-like DNA polymerase)